MNCRSFCLGRPPQEVLDTSTSAAAEALLFSRRAGTTIPRFEGKKQKREKAKKQKRKKPKHESLLRPRRALLSRSHKGRPRVTNAPAMQAERCRKESVCDDDGRDDRKSLTTNPTQPKERTYHPVSIEFVFGQSRRVGRTSSFWFKTFMHFSFYLMIAALVLLGVEVAYALYQLANFFL